MKKWIKKKKIYILFALISLIGLSNWNGFSHSVKAASTDEMAKGVNVQYHTQDEIREYIANSGADVNDALKFSEDAVTVKPYSLGKLSEETLKSAVAMVNQIRYIAGISYQVQLSDEYNELAQAASLANYVNDDLSHFPEQPDNMTDTMYNLAYKGASSSNIAWASWDNCSLNYTLVSSWMEDADYSNIDRVGHRRWILNPAMGKTGFGAVSGKRGTYSAVYAFDKSNSSADEYGVMWPAQNMPVEYFGEEYPWSISMDYVLNDSDVKVTLTRVNDGRSWSFSKAASDGDFYVDNGWYGQRGCIIFRPDKGIKKYNAGDIFKVDITGLSQGDVSYTVNFFELEPKPVNKVEAGSRLEDTKNIYMVTKIEENEKNVEYIQPQNKKNTSVNIPSIVKIDDTSYNVTSISEDAFKNCKNLKNITIGDNVSYIGKNAFKNCKNLKNIIIKSSNLTLNSVGKDAFKGVNNKVVITVPKKQYKVYKKLLRERGVVTSAKIKVQTF